ncbi:MAG: anti-sigma factor [Hyphomicrobiales bacterium]|nr:anti-sigma factor [Hyphomicrobiales bacterium]MCP5371995.1 anti-sigma factor [Hyphomicrobiales bacterium]
MSAARTLGEGDLHAYLDGELDAEGRAEVEAWLAGHPDASARLAGYRDHKAGLHALFDGVLDEPLPDSLRRTLAAGTRPAAVSPPGPPAWRRAAAAAVLLAAGGLGGWFGQRALAPETPPAAVTAPAAAFAQRAIGAHVVYAAEVRHPVEVGADEEKHLSAWLSKRLGRPLHAPALTEAGFRLVGGRLLPDGGAPAAQFMYENGDGQRVTVYLRQRFGTGTVAFRFAEHDGRRAFYWIDEPFACALIGDIDRDTLMKLSHLVYNAIENRTAKAGG